MPRGLAGMSWEAPALRRASALSAELDEQAGAPSRFSAVFSDPDLDLWAASDELVGTALTWDVDGGEPFRGRIWGRDISEPGGGPLVRFWGFDDSYRLNVCRGFRAYRGPLSSVASEAASGSGVAVRVAPAASGRYAGAGSQAVQYGETAWQFLKRLAAGLGESLIAARGTLYLGGPPGAGSTLDLDLDGPRMAGARVEVSESWCDRPPAYHVPLLGSPFPSTPRLSGADPGEAAVPPPRVADAIRRLAAVGAASTPAGQALNPSDRSALIRALDAFAERRGRVGMIALASPPDDPIALGAEVRLTRSGRTVLAGAVVAGVTHRAEGAATLVDLALGRPGSFDDEAPDPRPARHLWPAIAAGNYRRERGVIDVRPVGWHPNSAPLAARLLAMSTPPGPATVRVPSPGEILLIGFEGGLPDAPIVLGGLHDAIAPDAPAGGFAAEGGGGTLTVELGKDGLAAALRRIKLVFETDQTIKVLTSGMDVDRK